MAVWEGGEFRFILISRYPCVSLGFSPLYDYDIMLIFFSWLMEFACLHDSKLAFP